MLSRSILALTVAGVISSASAASIEIYKPGDQNDPRIRQALFLGENKRHLSALAELLKVQAEVDKPSAPRFPWLLGDNYISFGLRDRADAVYQAMGTTPAELVEFDKAQIKLARFEYTRGYLPESRATLFKIQDSLPKELRVEWQDLASRVLMEMGRYSEAIDVLTGPKNGGDQTEYTRYNLAVALLKEGRIDQGHSLMEKVGELSPTDRDSLALMDRANMTLGWNFLQSQQGAAARPILRRVRVEGLYSNRALLGLGWAELTQDGKAARHATTDDNNGKDADPLTSFSTLGVLLRRGLVDDKAKHNFQRIEGSSDREEAMKNALPPWLTLIDRDPQDPAVQEAWLALPYSLDQIGAHEQARQFYEQAVDRLENARKRTDLAIAAMKTNRMVETIVKRDLDAESGWDWELKDLPDAPETYYLQTLLAEHRFSEGLKNYRDVRLLARNLESWDRRLSEMEKAYGANGRASVDPKVLFARASEAHTPERSAIEITLTQDMKLAEPGRYKKALPVETPIKPQLRLAELPPTGTFVGSYERIGDLRKRLASLLPNLVKAGDLQGAYLQSLGTTELKAQKDQIEKYLVEARFSLARLYDRQSISNEPDEYEIKK